MGPQVSPRSLAKDWLELPNDVLDLMSKHLDNFEDLIRFSLVCQSWKSVSASLLPPKLTPWLIVPEDHMDFKDYKAITTCTKKLGFFSFYNGQQYEVLTPELEDRRIFGSCRGGWLLTMHENGQIQVYHPFSKSVIHLPHVTEYPGVKYVRDERNELRYTLSPYVNGCEGEARPGWLREHFIHKAIMYAGVVMAIHGRDGRLSFFRPRVDQAWGLVDGYHKKRLTDITFYQGDFYAVAMNGNVFVVSEIDTPAPYIQLVVFGPHNDFCYEKNYLVESSGELLMVTRYGYKFDAKKTDFGRVKPTMTDFKVLKVDTIGLRWVVINGLGEDRALFVGNNHSFSLSALSFPGIKGNCIYFTDDCSEEYTGPIFGGHDLGVFNLGDGTIEKFYESGSVLVRPLPFWFTTQQ